MDMSRRRAGLKTSVVAGSVWESRMKAFNGDPILDDQTPDTSSRKTLVKRSPTGTAASVKRKTWKSESFDAKSSSSVKNCDEQSRELSVSVDGIRKGRRGRSEIGAEKTPIQVKKDVIGNEKNSIQIRKSRSDVKEVVQSQSAEGQLRKVKSDSVNSPNQSGKDISIDYGMEKSDSVIEDRDNEENNGSEDSCKEFVVCEEQVVSHEEEDVVAIDYDDEEEEHEDEIENEVEKKSVDIVEIKLPEEKKLNPKLAEISEQEQKPSKKIEIAEKKIHQFRNRTAPPTSSTFKQAPPPLMRRAEIYQNLSNAAKQNSIPVKNEYQNFQERHSKLQNLVDLVMWRDISRSAFVFGIGTFIIISSSYTKDLIVSFISVISYLGLGYLAAIFLYRSLICRGVIEINDSTSCVFGEEEAIWILKLFLPYLNESLLRIKALFSGDPATTMKMAVLLFVFARCGSSITIWKMAKLGFFGVFIVPKVCSSYSKQLTGYAKFWIGRFRDAWDSCTHKKAVALAIFSLVWNLSSMVARVWAVFMMFVAVRYYQQSMESDDWVDVEAEYDDEVTEEDLDNTLQGQQIGGQRQGLGGGPRPTPLEINKLKKNLK